MENKISLKNRIISFLLKYGLIIISIIIGILGLCSIFITAYFETTYNSAPEFTRYRFSVGIKEIILLIIFTILISFSYKKIFPKISNTLLLIPLSIFIFIIYILWIYILKLAPIADQIKIHEITRYFIGNDLSFHLSPTQYLFLYPYQFGLIYFISFFYKIFGENYMVIEYFNTVCSIANFYLLYFITKEIFEDKNLQKIAILLIAGFSLYWLFFNVHFYGNIIGLTFALISILLILKYLNNNKLLYLLFAGLSTGMAILVKSNYNIFLCGIVIILLLDIIQNWNKKKIFVIPIFIISYLFISFSYNLIIEKKYSVDLPDGVPMINFIYMGMSENGDYITPGWYNDETLNVYYDSECNTEKSIERSKELIRERLNYYANNPNQFFKFYSQKIGSTWLNPTFQTIWCSTPGVRYIWDGEYATYISYHKTILDMVSSNGRLYRIEENYFNIYQVIIFIFSSIGIFIICKTKTFNLQKSLLPIIFIGGFLFHIIWETKAIYVIQYYYLLLPFAAYGINLISEKIIKIIEEKKTMQ